MSKVVIHKCDGCGETAKKDYMIELVIGNTEILTGIKGIPEIRLEACSLPCLRAILALADRKLGDTVPADK